MTPAPIHPLKAWRLRQCRAGQPGDASEPLSIKEAAASLGVSYHTWFYWENGRNIPDRDNMPKILALTGGEVDAGAFYTAAPALQAAE